MAKEKLSKEQIFEKLEDDIIKFFKQRLDKFTIPVDLKFYFQSNQNQKQLIKITKIPDQYSVILKKDLLVQVNQLYYDSFSTKDEDEVNIILFDQEIDLITVDMKNGTVKMGKPTVKTSDGIVKKYTYEKVKNAIELEDLYEQQKNDQ